MSGARLDLRRDPGLAALMPPLGDDEYAALRADIAKRGVLVPVEVDEHGVILDGHHRARACEELGIDPPRVVRSGLTAAEKRSHARALNLSRRHLSREDRRRLIADELREAPERSDRQIAAGLGVSHPTVAAVRSELVAAGDVENLSTRTDTLGRQQPVPAPRMPESPRTGPTVPELITDLDFIDRRIDRMQISGAEALVAAAASNPAWGLTASSVMAQVVRIESFMAEIRQTLGASTALRRVK